MLLPDFIIVGAAKCGTKALWYNLDKHPEIYMATQNHHTIEIHFWGDRFRSRGLQWYSSRFKPGKINGEKAVSYFRNRKALEDIKRHIPNVKIFLCVRNPVDRAYSHFQMHHNRGRVNRFNLDKYAADGRYIESLSKNVIPIFGRENVHICVAEYMKEDPTNEMKKVFEFLDVYDLNYPKKIISGQFLKNKTRQEDIRDSQQEKFYRVWSTWKGRLSGKDRQRCLEYYKPYNEKLFELLGYKIKEWSE